MDLATHRLLARISTGSTGAHPIGDWR